ncbi:MAG: hypothetical protein RBS24_00640 [Bacilli bacterium]|nr:hypothetical protein [Bacilli bacterium]
MKKIYKILIAVISPIISFILYTLLTLWAGLVSINSLNEPDNDRLFYLSEFLDTMRHIFFFVFGIIVTAFALFYLVSIILRKRIKTSVRMTINVLFVLLVSIIYIAFVYTTPLLGEPAPLNDIHTLFSRLYSIIVIGGCLVSGFAILFIIESLKSLRRLDVEN